MKNIKKLLSIVMVLAMVLALGVSAFADGPEEPEKKPNITIEPLEGDPTVHDYYAYQVFKGTQEPTADDNAPLGDLDWGKDVDGAKIIEALKADKDKSFEGLSGSTYDKDGEPTNVINAKDVAKFLEKNPGLADKFADIIEKTTGCLTVAGEHVGTGSATVDPGYYLIVDKADVAGKEGVARNKTMLQVTKDVTITPKFNIPSSEKKVLDWNDSDKEDIPITEITAGVINDPAWADTADHDIGDTVYFKLTGTMPADLMAVDETNAPHYYQYEVIFHDKEEAGLAFKSDTVKVYVNGEELKNQEAPAEPYYTVVTTGLEDGCTFEVRFADVKKIPKITNGAVITVIYGSELTTSANIGPTGNPNEMKMEYTNSSRNESKGFTKPDRVIVFTYKADVSKVDGNEKPLDGAGFTLYKWNAATNEWDQIGEEVFPTAVEDGEGNITGYTGEFKKGLDDGKYKIVETKTPPGFNTAEDIEFTIEARHSDDDAKSPDTPLKLEELVVKDSVGNVISKGTGDDPAKFTVEMSEGKLSTTVVNENGLELPETGGIGTTIFYVVGAILVAGAAILLVTKKRANDATK